VMADHGRGEGEDVEWRDEVRADHRMAPMNDVGAINRLRRTDRADIVELPGQRHDLGLVRGEPDGQGESPAERSHALGVVTGGRLVLL